MTTVNKSESTGLYLHVPFCLQKCPYCSFFSIVGNDQQYARFTKAVQLQASQMVSSGWSELEIATIFVGGGTPSILSPESLVNLLHDLRQQFVSSDNEKETSIEVNPATINLEDMEYLRQGGYNRISIGVQSLDDSELDFIGRLHNAAEAIQTVENGRKAGFSNVNVDLMYGLPGQTLESWRRTLHKALELDPDHLAIYELTIEEGSPFAHRYQQGSLVLPSEDEVVDMMRLTQEMVRNKGLSRYEISNYARPGYECRHNMNYWHNGSYFGLGPGAVSCVAGRRYMAIADVEEFCQRVTDGSEWWSGLEELDQEARFRETVIMGLRMTQGISKSDLLRRFGIDVLEYYGDTLHKLIQQDFVIVQEDRLHLSPTGMDLANQVMAQLV